MKKIIHRSENRGHANHGWLNAKHSFSFAHWYDPDKIHFGALRVLNDDEVAPGMGFGNHPHDNMEIITLVQEGALQHQDSMGNGSIMKPNDVQVMSAGTGVFHSEMNPSKTDAVKLFQIWVFPDKANVTPRYDQKTFIPEHRKNKWQEIVKPDTQTEGEGIFIHQQSWFNLCDLQAGNKISYTLKKAGNGSYIFVIDGCIETTGEILHKRDAIGIWEFETIEIVADQSSRILVMEVPMQF